MKYIYGPVQSRRLGCSLGVSLTPHKICSLDCVYCQLGPTKQKTLERLQYLPIDEIMFELRSFFSQNKGVKIDYITFSGFGEPMLNIAISELVNKIRVAFKEKIALITNSTFLIDKNTREEILGVDLIVPSLDAASQEVFEKIDQPCPGVIIEDIINALASLRREFKNSLWLEIMLIKGFNDSRQELDLLRAAVERINPDKIQLNSPVRAPKIFQYKALAKKRLDEIREFFGPRAEII